MIAFMQPFPVPPNTLIMTRTLPAKELAGVLGLFIVNGEHPDDGPAFKRIALLVKDTSVDLIEKTVTFTFYIGREPLTVGVDVPIESHIISTPPS